MQESSPDRISYSISRKLSTGNYESVSFNVSYSSDVGEEETPKDTLARVVGKVEKFAQYKEESLRTAFGQGPGQR